MSAVIDFNATYTDLLTEIEILKTRIDDMARERKFLVDSMFANRPKSGLVMDYSKDRVQGGFVPQTLDVIVERLNRIDQNLSIMNEQLKAKEDAKRRIENFLGQLEGLEYKVAYMRDVLNMRLYEIADKLGYSHDHIRRISSRIKKMPQRCHKNTAKS